MKSALSRPVLLAGVFVLGSPAAALACAVCGVDGTAGYNMSFAFLIGMPFAVAAALGGVFFYSARRGKF